MILENTANSVEILNDKDHTEQSQVGNNSICVTTTGSLNSKEHGDKTGLSVSNFDKWGGAPDYNQDDDIVWSACINKDAESGRNDQILDVKSSVTITKFQDGLEAILRREDIITRALLVRGAASFNDLVLFTNFTPAVLSTMRTQVNRWGTPAATLTIAWDIWDDIIADSDFVQWYINLPPNAAMC